jgi:cytochrome c oxidase subunit IV
LVEVLLAYLKAPLAMMLVALIALSVAKSAYIVGHFMHMRHERRSLKLAIFPVVVLLILALFAILPDAHAQCSMCRRVAEQSGGRLNRSILVLAAPPVLIMAAIVRALMKSR